MKRPRRSRLAESRVGFGQNRLALACFLMRRAARARGQHDRLTAVNCLRTIRLQGLHRGANAGQRNHAVERATALRDRYRKLRHGLPSALDERRCFLWEKHQSSWCHHACSEFCCCCARDDSHFGVGLRRQWYGYNHHDLRGCALAATEHQACNVLIGSSCICDFRDRYRIWHRQPNSASEQAAKLEARPAAAEEHW